MRLSRKKTRRSGNRKPGRTAKGVSTPLLVESGALLEPGKMYVRLFHGRTDPDQEMDGWGFDGPVFGPLSACVQTYCTAMRLYGTNPFVELWLDHHDDMVRWKNCFYGDVEVFLATGNERASKSTRGEKP